MRSKFILLLALLMGIVTTLLFYQYTKKIAVEKTAAAKTIAIVVAKEKIDKNEQITAKKLDDGPNAGKGCSSAVLKEF